MVVTTVTTDGTSADVKVVGTVNLLPTFPK